MPGMKRGVASVRGEEERMGAGVGPLEGHQVFRIYIEFRDDNGAIRPLQPDDPIYTQFVDALEAVLRSTAHAGSWYREPQNPQAPVRGGMILLRGPVPPPAPVDLNCELDRVLLGVRVEQRTDRRGKRMRKGTGVGAVVRDNGNVGPALDEWTSEHGPENDPADPCIRNFIIRRQEK
jgi:hypothetical protein